MRVVPELRPRTVGEILDVAVLLYRARFAPLMKVTLAVTLPVSLLTMFVLLSAVPDDETAALRRGGNGADFGDFDLGAAAIGSSELFGGVGIGCGNGCESSRKTCEADCFEIVASVHNYFRA